ncbi:MAG: flagellar hook-basal body complex protein, partial [Bacillota bacterium]
MMRSMYAGVSGLKSHQTKMDVVGNNISNVNTTGYKGSRVNFKEMLSQNLQGAKAPQGEVGGVNPQQIGLGVDVGSINTNTEQGNSQSTGNNTDLSIEGNGYFTVNDGQKNLFTRDGSMSLDEDGSLVNGSTGYKAQGWMADENGNIDTNSDVEDIEIPIGDSMPGKESTEAAFSGNLDGRAIGGDSRSATIDVYDSLGEKHTLDVGYQRKTESEPVYEDFEGDSGEEYDFRMEDTSGDLNDVDINFEQDDSVTNDIGKSFDEENKEITLTYDWAKKSSSTNDKDADDVEDVINNVLDSEDYGDDTFRLKIDDGAGAADDFVMGDFENQAVTLSAPAANEWDWTVSDISDAEFDGGDTGTLEFDSDGRIKENTELGTIEFNPEGGAEDGQEVELDFSRLTQSAA